MGAPYSGGCQCGRIRYQLLAEPLSIYLCHCQQCQKQSSSAFGMSMPVPRSSVLITQGQPKQWSRQADTGREVMCLFCGDCGTRLFHNPARNPNITNIKPGTLDDTSWLQPVGSLWTRSAQKWVRIPEPMLNYEGQPDDYSLLWEQWKTTTKER